MPPDIEIFNLFTSELRKNWITNHQRLKFNNELLQAVFEHSKIELGDSILSPGNKWKTNALTRMIYSILSEELDVYVSPFNTLNADGYVQPLYECLPKMIKLICVGKKPKIVKAMLYLLGQLIHRKQKNTLK